MSQIVLSKEECSNVFLSAYPNYPGYGEVHYNISTLEKNSVSSRSSSLSLEPPQAPNPSFLPESPENYHLDTPSFSLSPQKQITHPDPAPEIENRPISPKPSKNREDKKSDELVAGESYHVNLSIVDYTVGSLSNFSAFELDSERKPEESILRGDTFGTSQLVYEKTSILERSTENEGFEKKDSKIHKLSIQNSITNMANEGSKHKKEKEDKNSGRVCAQCLVI